MFVCLFVLFNLEKSHIPYEKNFLSRKKKITDANQICSNIKILAFSRENTYNAYPKLQVRSYVIFFVFLSFPLKQMKYYMCDRISKSEWKSEK